MKTIGIIGGMSWESTVTYYQQINRLVKERLGGLHSAKCIVFSVDFAEIEAYQSKGEWDKAGAELADVAKKLELAGADMIVLATNTMHKVISPIEEATKLPVIRIADATAEAIRQQGLNRVALLGTKYTMEQDFYKGRVQEHGVDVMVPDPNEQEQINHIIFNELVLGEFRQESKQYYLDVVDRLLNSGAEGVIFGCTEIGLLIQAKDVSVPVFDTSLIHVERAVAEALSYS
ncbi:aspartate racemase [Alkalibacillus flavidus]|uniref:Aspartate racemase n=1 Tax=Alkalibacillus flavidus TaxID=546021 RepID=A0ABV2L0K3_9BACI